MNRIKLTVAYDGSGYSGWQFQPGKKTIESALNEAVYELTGRETHVIGASRTDAGVHALGNVAVFDTDSNIPGERWAYALNRYLPDSVRIVDSRRVNPEFHPRRCRTVKTYEYKILNGPVSIPQLRMFVWHVQHALDVDAMQKAAQFLVGEHDFKSFCCVRTHAESTVRTIYSLQVESEPYFNASDGMPAVNAVTIRVTGNGFLYNMVRIIAGTLMQVGKGQISADSLELIMEQKERAAAGQTAPPQGLTLAGIRYIDGEDAAYPADA